MKTLRKPRCDQAAYYYVIGKPVGFPYFVTAAPAEKITNLWRRPRTARREVA